MNKIQTGLLMLFSSFQSDIFWDEIFSFQACQSTLLNIKDFQKSHFKLLSVNDISTSLNLNTIVIIVYYECLKHVDGEIGTKLKDLLTKK